MRSSLAGAGKSLYPTAAMLLGNKSRAYQQQVVSCAQAIAEFYTDSQLAVTDLRRRFLAAPEEFSFTSDDLNEAGKNFTQEAFHRWLDSLDRWTEKADRSTEGYKASLLRAYTASTMRSARKIQDLR